MNRSVTSDRLEAAGRQRRVPAHELMLVKVTFPANRPVWSAPGATARCSHEGGRTEVGTHRYQISQRLMLLDVAGTVRYAIRHDLVQEDV